MYPIERYIIPERGLAMEILGIGDRLRTLRTHRKMTIKQVSERLGISASVLSEYELDVKNPSYRNLLHTTSVTVSAESVITSEITVGSGKASPSSSISMPTTPIASLAISIASAISVPCVLMSKSGIYAKTTYFP